MLFCTYTLLTHSLISTLNASTHHLVDAAFLRAMKPSAYLVNIGRGPLVDTPALVEALHKNEIAGAGLDVLEGEPNISADHPLMAPELEDKVLVLPHIASATFEARFAMGERTALNVLGGLGLRDDGPADAMPSELC